MRILNSFLAVLAAGVCFSFAQAQNPGDDMTDRLLNPSFEEAIGSNEISSNGRIFVPKGWTFLRETAGWNDYRIVYSGEVASDGKNYYFDSYEGNQHISYWGEKVTSLNLYQEVSDLPEGAYQLTAMVRLVTHQSDLTAEQKITDQHLYAKILEGDSTISSIMPLSAVGDTPENWTKLTVLFNVAEEGQVVRLGIASTNDGTNDAGGFQIDDCQLMYLGNGDAFLIQIKAAINDYLGRCNNLIGDPLELANGESEALQTIYDEVSGLGAVSDSATLNDAYLELRNAYDRAKETHDLQSALIASINDANANLRADNAGKETFESACDEALNIVYSYVEDPVYKEDVEQAIADFAAAYRTYRLTEVEVATEANPADLTWIISCPDFSDAAGQQDNTGWNLANNPVYHTEYKLNTINGRNCWNNWNDGFVSMDIYQEFTGLPVGKYAITCLTTTNGVPNDQHAYVSSSTGTAVSEVPLNSYYPGTNFNNEAEWVNVQSEKTFVSNDGNLRIGFRSTCGGGTSGWYCVTGFKLFAYGSNEADYATAFENRLAEMAGYKDSTMMKGDKTLVDAAIDNASATSRTDIEAMDATFESLNQAETLAKNSISAYNSYTNGEYAVSMGYLADDNETMTNATAKAFLKEIVEKQAEVMNADTTHYLIMSALIDQLDAYNNYIISYNAAQEYILSNISLAKSMVDSHNEINEYAEKAVIDSLNADLKTILTPLQAFDAQAKSAEELLMEGGYTEEGIIAMEKALETQIEVVESAKNIAAVETASQAMKQAIRALQLAKEGEGPKEITAWIENSAITQDNGAVGQKPSGWADSWNSGTNGNFTKAAFGDTYLEAWNSRPGTISFDYNQSINDLPAGYYRLVADVRTSQGLADGNVVLYAISNKGEYQTPVYNVEYLDGNTETSSTSDEFYSATVDSIAVSWRGIQIGIKTIGEIATCWTAADNFQLYYLGEGGLVGIEDINSDASAEELEIEIVDKRIRVLNADEYYINDVNGISYSKDTQVKAGTLYIISAPGKKSRSIMLIQ